jgi:steroid delta-isomerase-like uncharacterized protein
MADTGAISIARELIESFNANDWPSMRELLADDVTYDEAGTGRHVEGAEAYIELCQAWLKGFPDGRGTINAALADSHLAVVDVTWNGTHTGELAGPAGIVAATGRSMRTPGSFWVREEDGRAKAIRHHLDVLTLLTQIGVLGSG